MAPIFPNLIKTLDALAVVHAAAGRPAEAVPYMQRIIAIVEKTRGPDHIELRPWLEKLVRYQPRKSAGETETLYQRALAIVEKAHGPDNLEVLEPLGKLAEFYASYSQAQYARAEYMYKRGLAIVEKARGGDHVETRRWHDELGALYKRQYRHGDAEAEYLRSLAIVEMAGGPDHPDIADALDKLGQIYIDWRPKQHANTAQTYLRLSASSRKPVAPITSISWRPCISWARHIPMTGEYRRRRAPMSAHWPSLRRRAAPFTRT